MGLLDHKRMALLVAVALARLLQPAYVPPESCTYAEKKLGCVPNRIPMASTYGPFDLVPEGDDAVDWRVSSTSEAGGGGGGERIVRVGPPAWIVRSEWEE